MREQPTAQMKYSDVQKIESGGSVRKPCVDYKKEAEQAAIICGSQFFQTKTEKTYPCWKQLFPAPPHINPDIVSFSGAFKKCFPPNFP